MDKFMDGGSGGRINGLVDEKWVAGEKQGKQTGYMRAERMNKQNKNKKKKIGDQGSGDITQPSSVEVYETATV